MPKIKSSFTLKSKAPNFERDSFQTKLAMKEVPVGHMDEGHISYCQEDGKHYSFSVYNSYDPETGFFKLFQSGGGGGGGNISNDDINRLQNQIKEINGNMTELSTDVGDWNESSNMSTILKDVLDRVNELYGLQFKVSCSIQISGGNTVLEYNNEYVNREVTLNISVSYKNTAMDRSKIDSLTIAATDKTAGTDDCTIGTYDKNSTSVKVSLPSHPNSKYTFKLTVSAMGQTATSTVTIYQRAPYFFGWSTSPVPVESMCVATNSENVLFRRGVGTTIINAGHNFTSTVPAASYFWTLVPEHVTKYNKVNGNGYEVQMGETNKFNDVVFNDGLYEIKVDGNGNVVYHDFDNFTYRGVKYYCKRQPTPTVESTSNWNMKFS